ncbi:MAG: aspartate aminotransferase family protein, partial [Proteobacteria bacterium]|nr:aspartate aminotransferase family protein [Pseudomonadota bacterium]
LKTDVDRQVNNFRDWGIQLGRRFRALKLWFVIRHFGRQGLMDKLRLHLALAREFETWVRDDPAFEILAPVTINLVCFRYRPDGSPDEEALERMNKALMDRLNRSGRMFLTHTKLKGRFALRMCIGQTHVQRRHVEEAWRRIKETAAGIES